MNPTLLLKSAQKIVTACTEPNVSIPREERSWRLEIMTCIYAV